MFSFEKVQIDNTIKLVAGVHRVTITDAKRIEKDGVPEEFSIAVTFTDKSTKAVHTERFYLAKAFESEEKFLSNVAIKQIGQILDVAKRTKLSGATAKDIIDNLLKTLIGIDLRLKLVNKEELYDGQVRNKVTFGYGAFVEPPTNNLLTYVSKTDDTLLKKTGSTTTSILQTPNNGLAQFPTVESSFTAEAMAFLDEETPVTEEPTNSGE